MKKILLFVWAMLIVSLVPGWTMPIHEAAAKGDVAEVTRLLTAGASVQAVTEIGDTPLHYAAAMGQIDTAKLLLENGANINAKDNAGWTPLLVATITGNTTMCQLLLEKGADMNVVTGKNSERPSRDDANQDTLAGSIQQLIIDRKNAEKAANRKAFWMMVAQSAKMAVDDYNARQDTSTYTTFNNKGELVKQYTRYRGTPYEFLSPDMARAMSHIDHTPKDIIINPSLPSVGERVKTTADIASCYFTAGRTPLHNAVIADDIDTVKLLLGKGAKANVVDEDGATPLMLANEYDRKAIVSLLDTQGIVPLTLFQAVQHGTDEDVTRLLAAGADMTARENATLLPIAARRGRLAMVNALLAKGANVNAPDASANTPLHYAAQGGYTEIAQVLLANKADVNARNEAKETPLNLATWKGHTATVQVLLANKADVNARDAIKQTPLELAAAGGYIEIVKLLIDNGADTKAINKVLQPALLPAVASGNLEAVKYLLEHKVNPNEKDLYYGRTPIYTAAGDGNNEMVTLLIDHGASLKPESNLFNPSCMYSALSMAASHDHLDTVQLLLDRGAKVTGWKVTIGGSYSSYSPLHGAAQGGNVKIIQLLLDKGAGEYINLRSLQDSLTCQLAEVTSATPPDKTPLFFAVEGGHAEAVSVLLNAGANPNTRSAAGQTPLVQAIEIGNTDIVKSLIAHQADLTQGSPLHQAAQAGRIEMMKLLLVNAAGLEQKNGSGQTPLHTAALYGQTAMVQWLIEKGANLQAKDKNNQTPLQLAVTHNRVDTVRFLIEKNPTELTLHAAALLGRDDDVQRFLIAGADVNGKDALNATPLHKAIISGNMTLITRLLDKGAQINAQDSVGLTPLHLAAIEGQTAAVNLLLTKGANVETVDQMGATPLIWAAFAGETGIAEQLIVKSARVNAQDADGNTPLMWAASTGNLPLIRILVRHGADLNEGDISGNTPLSIAQEQQQPEVEHLLRRYIALANGNTKNK